MGFFIKTKDSTQLFLDFFCPKAGILMICNQNVILQI
jgi:hypothetical protein